MAANMNISINVHVVPVLYYSASCYYNMCDCAVQNDVMSQIIKY